MSFRSNVKVLFSNITLAVMLFSLALPEFSSLMAGSRSYSSGSRSSVSSSRSSSSSRSYSSPSYSRPSSSSYSRPSSSSYSRPTPSPTPAPSVQRSKNSYDSSAKSASQYSSYKIKTSDKEIRYQATDKSSDSISSSPVSRSVIAHPTTTTVNHNYGGRSMGGGMVDSPWFWMWLMNQSSASRAQYIYNHPADVSQERLAEMKSKDAELEKRLASIEASGAKRDETFVPDGYQAALEREGKQKAGPTVVAADTPVHVEAPAQDDDMFSASTIVIVMATVLVGAFFFFRF